MPKQKTVEDYGSIYEWVRQEWLLPFLVIGGNEDKFWTLTPKSIQLYFEVARRQRVIREQEMWAMGQYVRLAIASTVSNCAGMTDYKKYKLPEYPKCPGAEEDEPKEVSKEFIQKEEMRLIMFLNQFKKNK